ncbi:lysophospholipid acyltransferase family protein [Acinetobacter puyangensis]|nr:lysophospholipid acyltransferase family protein [Acinetobacter puyangensis]
MLTRKINYYWRVAATGFSFATFGAGGLLIAVVISPTVKLLKRQPEQQHQLAQKIIKHSFKGFVDMMKALGIMTYDVEGIEKLENSYGELVIANHPTLIDVVLLIGLMPQANCVVKQALWSNLFTRGPVQSAGYILNLGSEQFIQSCVSKLLQCNAASLVIFPEGTRTLKGRKLNDFQRGAANIALRAKVPIRPVSIRCTPSTLTKNEKWYHIPDRPFHIEIKVLDALNIDEILPQTEVNPKNVRQLNVWLYDFFDKELSK